MRSRTVRVTVTLIGWIALGLAAFFLIRTQQHIATLTGGVRAFDLHARETSDTLADLRAAQQAYVAAGQGVAFWMPKVSTTTGAARSKIVALRRSAPSGAARAALTEAESAIAEFEEIDARARDYLKSGEPLMAADVIFTEGGETAAKTARDVERARVAEHEALDASEAAIHSQQALALGGAAAIAGLFLLLLALTRSRVAADEPAPQRAGTIAPAPVAAVPRVSRTASILKTAADLCTDFGRIRDISDLKDLLVLAAEAMDASGLVVWLGSTTGADLQPIVSHGYSPQAIARMPAVPKSGDNAAAAAYRTGTLQIVLSRPGGLSGALVAPLLAPEGCIGALSAETRHGGEGSESVQALAVIFAAQLAGIFATNPIVTSKLPLLASRSASRRPRMRSSRDSTR